MPVSRSTISSGRLPTAVATTARPAAIASRTALGIPSLKDGCTRKSQARRNGAGARNPRKRTLLPTPARRARASSDRRREPSPSKTRVAPGQDACTAGQASRSQRCPLMASS